MSIKHILVPLTGHGDATHAATCALKLAQQFNAHVTGTAVGDGQSPFIDPAGAGLSADYYEEVIKAVEKAAAHARAQARRHFDAAIQTTKVATVDTPPCGQASAYWRDTETRAGDDSVLALGRLADLIVVHRGSSIGDRQVMEDAIFGVRRPVLMMPPKTADIGRDAALAWNGSRESSDAVERALDLLEPGATVTILQAGDLAPGATPAAEAAAYLGWHGFKPVIRQVADHPKTSGQILLREAHDAGAGLLIMGAYTHSRLREMMFGGVTSFMLHHATIPVLMAH